MIRALAAACHPGPTVAVSLIGGLLGFGVGLGAAHVVLLVAAVLAGQLSVGWSNDVIDATRDAGAGRTDKPAATGRVGPRVLWSAAAAAAAATLGLSLALGPRAGAAQLLLPVAGWAYNLGLKATWWSAAAYVVGFGGLAAAPYLALPGHPAPPWWAPVTGALLGVAAHVANVLPDLREDAAAGVRGLPHRLGQRGSAALLAAVLIAAAVVTAVGSVGSAAGSGARTVGVLGAAVAVVVAAASAVLAWRRPASEAAFYGVVTVALLDVVLFVLAT